MAKRLKLDAMGRWIRMPSEKKEPVDSRKKSDSAGVPGAGAQAPVEPEEKALVDFGVGPGPEAQAPVQPEEKGLVDSGVGPGPEAQAPVQPEEKGLVDSGYNFLREICMMWSLDPANHVQLGGPGQVVEIDESKLYRAKYNRGRGLNRRHKWVFGLIQRGSHRCVVVPVATRDAATLLPIIRQWVLPGTTIVSDSWAAYGGIAAMQGQNYVHLQVNHRYNFVNPTNPLAHTQGIESMWSNLKRQLHHLQGTSDALFESYLFLYMWRRAMHPNDNQFGDILYYIRQYNPL